MVSATEHQTPGGASRRPWAQLLETVLACPSCKAVALELDGPRCGSCGWEGRTSTGVIDFVDESTLSDGHHAEMTAQGNAVEEYYENESKLCCHWDRISAGDLPGRMQYPSGIVLDLGCGTGTAGGALRRSGARVIGADLSVPCLLAAERRLDAVVRTDAAKLPFADGVFDGLVARGALHHMADPLSVLAEARRVLKPGAPALFLDPREFAWLEPIKDALRKTDESFTDDHHAYSLDEYRSLISSAFLVERTYTEHPFGVLVANGIDLLPLPEVLPPRLLAKGLFRLDSLLNRTPLSKAGHLLVAEARRR